MLLAKTAGRPDPVQVHAHRAGCISDGAVLPTIAPRHVPQLERNSRDASGGAKLGFGPADLAPLHPGCEVFPESRLGPQFDPLAPFRVRLGRRRRLALLGVFLLDGDRRRPQLAFKVGSAVLDGVELTALLIVERVDQAELGHPAALLGLAIAKLTKFLLGLCHVLLQSRSRGRGGGSPPGCFPGRPSSAG